MGNRQSAEDDTEDTERYNNSDEERNDPADDELLTSSGTGKKRKLEVASYMYKFRQILLWS